jgi:branched-chain amino acid transport system permease protein
VNGVLAPRADREPRVGDLAPTGGTRLRSLLIIPAAAGGLVLVALPFVLGTYAITTAGKIVIYTLLAVSLVLVMGIAGMPSLGQAAMFGVGGYCAGLLALHATSNVLLMLVVAMAGGGLCALVTGWMVVRGSRAYLIMLTLAIGELLSQGAISWVSVTGGSDGLANVPTPSLGFGDLSIAGQMYWLALGVVAVLVLLVHRMLRSPLGRTLRAIRDNEPRMRGLGYRTRTYRYLLYAVAGALSGAAGGLWVAQSGYISPADMNFQASAFALLAVCVGGATSLWGAACGAALIILVQDLLPSSLQGRGPLVLGLVLVAVVYMMPGGIAGVAERARLRWRRAR